MAETLCPLMPRKFDKTGTSLQRQRGLACLEIRSRNEEAINSTRNMIHSLRFFISYFIDVDTFHLFLNWFSTRVSDDQKYLSGSRLYAGINTQKFKGLDSREITWLPDISGQISKTWFKWYVISIIAENKSHAHYKTHLHTVKVYNTRPSQLC